MTAFIFVIALALFLTTLLLYYVFKGNDGNKMMDGGVILLVVIFLLAVGGSQVYRLSDKPHHTGNPAWVGHDQPAEELIEVVHGALTGSQVDLTPDSPEE